jgi:hypothetical protein
MDAPSTVTFLLSRMMILAVQEKKLQFTIPHFPMTSEKGNTRKGFVEPAKFRALTLCRNICVPICCSIMPVPISKELRAMLKKLFWRNGPVFDTCNFRKAVVGQPIRNRRCAQRSKTFPNFA